jgi:transcriptional regulator with PAS, ATPase and Fis domain
LSIFDKASYVRIAILAEGYFRARASGDGAARVQAGAARSLADQRSSFHGIVGASPAMRRLYEQIEAAALVRGTILLVGESGTGKELVARAIHESTPAPGAPFIAVNCAAIPKDLIDELFGYRRGAFSGAVSDFPGLFRAADKGTLFLDEVTEMSPATQSKVLRAIQERTVRPLGSTSEIPVDVRLIASTNRDPEQAVREGQLREDLYLLPPTGQRSAHSAAARTSRRHPAAGRALHRHVQFANAARHTGDRNPS